jgi:hypothetical protein
MNPSEHELPIDGLVTINPPTAKAAVRDWARETLELPPEISSVEMPSAILKCIAECDYLPGRQWQDAIAVLTAQPLVSRCAVPNGYYHDYQAEMRAKVETFATTFFDLAPPKRRAQWEVLKEQCACWPPLSMWLTRLEAGLSFELPAPPEITPRMSTFLRFISQQFVQCPGQRSQKTWEQLHSTFEDKKQWQRVACNIQRQFPELAAMFDAWIHPFAWHSADSRRMWSQWLLAKLNKEPNPKGSQGLLNTPIPPLILNSLFAAPIVIAAVLAIFNEVSKPKTGNQSQQVRNLPFSKPPYQASSAIQIPISYYEKLASLSPTESKRLADLLDRMGPPEIAEIKRRGSSASADEKARLKAYEQSREPEVRAIIGSSVPEPLLTFALNRLVTLKVPTPEDARAIVERHRKQTPPAGNTFPGIGSMPPAEQIPQPTAPGTTQPAAIPDLAIPNTPAEKPEPPALPTTNPAPATQQKPPSP